MLTLSTLTLFVRDLYLSTVFIRATTSVHASRPFLYLTLRDGQLFAPHVSRVPESLCTNCAHLVAFVAGNVLFRQASFPNVQREFPALARDVSPARRCASLTISSQVEEQHATYARPFFFPLRHSDIWYQEFPFVTEKCALHSTAFSSVVKHSGHILKKCRYGYSAITHTVEIFTIGSNVIISL